METLGPSISAQVAKYPKLLCSGLSQVAENAKMGDVNYQISET